MNDPSIVVIIAAYNAEDTVGRAVRSALAADQVAEVIVIDDASTDKTAEAARQAADQDSRFTVLLQATNRGPSAARNRAIRESKAPFIAILDADDFLLPGRFAPFMAEKNWDLCADNILFFKEPVEVTNFIAEEPEIAFFLDFEHFVTGNISDRKRVRGELGFLKPVIRRSFLEDHRLFYDEDCRLGEDFILYTRALAEGGRFKVVGECGYAAQVRSNSLSGSHGVADLKALHIRCLDLLRGLDLAPFPYSILSKHARSIKRKIIHRQVLDIRRQKGLLSGIMAAARNPSAITDILADRLSPPRPEHETPRLLLKTKDAVKYSAEH